ncbi:MAG: hypothetical protein JWM95_5612 [Gemmatimonadetes bacterium]|nr:hypothetical protein [Gemmatimonadota bacterium]
MSDTREPLDLSSLETDYEIVGEMSGGTDTRRFMANRKQETRSRRDDDGRVLITIVTTPRGDEGNALSHLAADTNLLSRTQHRRLIPVLEGRWIGKDAFAVITARTTDASLAEKLATGEKFSPPRTAAILREVNGLIEWAREQKIVHRCVTPSDIYLEPSTDRVRVAFSVSRIPRIQHASSAEDARTIARLALAMLTGFTDPRQYEGESLAVLRPDLPARLGEASTALLDDKRDSSPEEVAAYLAIIGMADPLHAGETEAARIRAEVLEEQRAEREKLANERAQLESDVAADRAKFAQEMADERERLANERAELQRAVTEEREQLLAMRTELERAVAEQRAEIERVAANDRALIESLRAELKAAGEAEIEKKRDTALEDVTDDPSVLDASELETPTFIPMVAPPLPEILFENEMPLAEADVAPPTRLDEVVPVATAGTRRSRWVIPGAIAGVVAVIVIALVAIASRRTPAAAPVPEVARAAPVVPAPVTPASVVPLPTSATVIDSAAGSIGPALDSTPARAVAVKPKPKKRVVPRDTTAGLDTLFQIRRDTTRKPDTVTAP